LIETQRAATHVIHEAARSADDDLSALLKPVNLTVVRLPAVNRQGVDTAFEKGELVQFFRDLDCEFASGTENQDLNGALMCIDFFNGWNTESCGFAGAGLRLTDNVATREEERNGFGLDGRSLLEPKAVDGFENVP